MRHHKKNNMKNNSHSRFNEHNNNQLKQVNWDMSKIQRIASFRAQRDVQNCKFCHRCGYNPYHVTLECTRIPSWQKIPRENSHKNNAIKVSCDFCAKPGHQKQDCFSNPDSSNYKGPGRYAFRSPYDARNSSRLPLFHDDVDMLVNELPADESRAYCTYCMSAGHDSSRCHSLFSAQHYTTCRQEYSAPSISAPGTTFSQQSSLANVMSVQLEEMKRAGTVTAQDVLKAECEILKQRVVELCMRFPGAADDDTSTTSSTVPSAIPYSFRNAQNYSPNFTCADTTQTAPPTNVNSSNGIGWPYGITREQYDLLLRFKEAEAHNARTTHEHNVRRKIQESQKYGLEWYNNHITLYENFFMEKACLTRGKMDDVKGGIRKGYQLFRDPRAMEALFYRRKPCCSTCHRQGVIVDRHMATINPCMSSFDLLHIEDNMNFGEDRLKWGVFVVFDCKCVLQAGSEYIARTPQELQGCPESDIPKSVREQWI